MDAKQIIDAMRENYLRCISYEDRGSISRVGRTLAEDKILSGKFTNTFIRPNLLKFDLTTDEDGLKRHFMLQADGDSVRAFDEHSPDVRPVQTLAFDSFKGALQTVGGITEGVTNTVLSLLGEINPKYSLLNASTLQRADDEIIEAVPCYKIEFVIDPFVAIEGTAWVSIDSFTLRRLEERTVYTQEFGAFAIEQTKIFLEAEGISHNEEDQPISLTRIFSFAEVTFNNSISIDKITDHRF